MEAICKNMNTRINTWSEMGVGKHVELKTDVDVEVSSSLLSAMFILMLISVVRRIFSKKKKLAPSLLAVFSFALATQCQMVALTVCHKANILPSMMFRFFF